MLGRTYDAEVCSIARALEVVGERWSVLIVRNALFAGATRFADFQRSLGIATNVLASRLDGFVEAGIMRRHRYSEQPEAYEYLLTEKGRDLAPALIALTAWGDRWSSPATARAAPTSVPRSCAPPAARCTISSRWTRIPGPVCRPIAPSGWRPAWPRDGDAGRPLPRLGRGRPPCDSGDLATAGHHRTGHRLDDDPAGHHHDCLGLVLALRQEQDRVVQVEPRRDVGLEDARDRDDSQHGHVQAGQRRRRVAQRRSDPGSRHGERRARHGHGRHRDECAVPRRVAAER